MNLLFHVEPMIELGRPYWKTHWASTFAAMIIGSLRGSGEEHGFAVVVNEPVAERLNLGDDVRRVVLMQPELLRGFGHSALAASLAWYGGDYTEEQEADAAATVRRGLDGFEPDVVIAFSPAPYLSRAFPDALVLHMEYSLFSRAPYPATWYLDPCGMLASSFVARFADRIATQPLGERERRLLAEFRGRCRSLLRERSPFRALLERERGRFGRLVLLPLQFSGYYGFDGNVPFRSQYEYLAHVLESVPPTIGVVVTTHPDYPVLEHEAVAYLASRYPHFVFREEFENHYASSQFLLAEVDGMINVSSSLGPQALLLDRKLVTLGRCYRPQLADTDDLARLPEVLERPPADRDPLLFWMLTRYAVPERFLRDPRWLSRFLLRSLECRRAGRIDEGFFDPIAPPRRVFAALESAMDLDVPKARTALPPHVAIRRKDEIIGEKEAIIGDLVGQLRTVWERAEQANVRLRSSRSWRITRPLRAFGRFARRLIGGFRGPAGGGE